MCSNRAVLSSDFSSVRCTFLENRFCLMWLFFSSFVSTDNLDLASLSLVSFALSDFFGVFVGLQQ